MKKLLHNPLAKIALLAVAILSSPAMFAQSANTDDAIVMNSSNNEPSEYNAAKEDKNLVSHISGYSSVSDISMQNYFNLSGKKVAPYMQVDQSNQSFDPQIIEANNVSFVFESNSILVKMGNESKTFTIENVEQYQNTSASCLIKSKIEVGLKTEKMNGNKISSLSIFIDRDNHISFIQLGDTEYYLRP